MQRFILLQIQQKSVRRELSGFGNEKKQQRGIWGSASGRGTYNVSSAVCMLHGGVSCRNLAGFRLEAFLDLPGKIAEKMAHAYREEQQKYSQLPNQMTWQFINQANSKQEFQLACQAGFPKVLRCNFYRNYYSLLPLTLTSVQRKSDFIRSTQ